MSATEPTFRVQGTYTDNAGKQQTVSAKVKAQSESQAKKKAQNSLSKKYKNLQVSQTEKLSEGVDEQLGTYTIVHGTADPVHREERLYTIVENATKEQARKLAQDNLPKSEQDRYIIETTEGKYVPNGHKPNYVNPVKQQQDEQKKQQQLDESLKRNVEQDNDTGHEWRHASLYEDVDRSRMLHLAGVKGKPNRGQTLNEADTKSTEVTFKRRTDSSDGSVSPVYLSEDGREHYPVKISAGVPEDVKKKIINALPKSFDWRK